jgi:hypothetical protein
MPKRIERVFGVDKCRHEIKCPNNSYRIPKGETGICGNTARFIVDGEGPYCPQHARCVAFDKLSKEDKT